MGRQIIFGNVKFKISKLSNISKNITVIGTFNKRQKAVDILSYNLIFYNSPCY